VIATGPIGHRYIPEELHEAGASHSSDHVTFDEFAGLVVAVVGGGQSALETAAFLAGAGAYPYLVVRARELVWNATPRLEPATLTARLLRPQSGIGAGWRALAAERLPEAIRLLPEDRRIEVAFSTLGPAGAWWLRPLVEDRVPILSGYSVIAVEAAGGRVRLSLAGAAGARTLDVDHVIAATGYRWSLDAVDFLHADLRSHIARIGAAPRLSRSFESSAPGIHFVGFAAASTFGPSMRFVCGTSAAARLTARAVARDRRRRKGHAPNDDLLVLCYHAVSAEWDSHLAVHPKALATQLAYLAERGYRSVCFTELVTERPSGRVVAVTFDDAYHSVLTEALPVLESLRMRGTTFVPTRYAEAEACADWPGMEAWQSPDVARHLRTMGWDALRQLAGAGWEIGSHGHTHIRLRGLDPRLLDREMQVSKALCEDRLDRPCRSIAYPYGSPGTDLDRAAVRAAARAGYLAGATVPRRLAPVEPLLWPRVSIGAADSFATFRTKVSPQTRLLRTMPGWPIVDAPRRIVRDHLLANAAERRAHARTRR
jgi:peptidoglycan/xylan/chitin deacetylase (PgdA/CDA1 family)